MGYQQIVIEEAGQPGTPNSYYSEEITLTAVGSSSGSPPVAGDVYTLIPEAGFIFLEDMAANVSLVLRLTESPPTYAPLIAASGQGQSWSDGANLFVKNASGTDSDVKYFVLGRKP